MHTKSITVQTCTKCKQDKPKEEFYVQRTNGKPDRRFSACKNCQCLVSKKYWKYRKNTLDGNLRLLYHNTKKRAKTKHQAFKLTLIGLKRLYNKQNGLCAITSYPMTYVCDKGRQNTNISLDRIDSTKGYIRGNVQLVCVIINIMKQNMEMPEFKEWCSRVIKPKD